ncbi:MAG: transposase [bacterium]|nr:transposase [bacterium]
MPSRSHRIAPFEHYHLFNRGVNHQQIFFEERDIARFVFLILHKQSPTTTTTRVEYYTKEFLKHRVWSTTGTTKVKMVGTRSVELVNFCLMDNHFHLTVRELKEGGTSKYMQRILNAYTKYFNTKYKRKGHLFEGPFKAVRVDSNVQLLHLSAYIHRNPRDMHAWRGKEAEYPWSSLQDFIVENRWGRLLSTNVILEQFGKDSETQQKGYKKFVETSTAKSQSYSLPQEHFFEK